jgi:heme/copper-type cytochrome/quinol oxidase subunit 3
MVMYFHGYTGGIETFSFGTFSVITCATLWWRDVTREGTLEGRHTNIVQLGLRYGMILFIVSEVMFFFRLFLGLFLRQVLPQQLKLEIYDLQKVLILLIH